MTDPQQLVDDALATPATSSMPNLPLTPTAVVESPVVPPVEPMTAQMPPLPPMPSTPEPIVPPIAPTPTVAMGDETPLAFMTPPPTSTPPAPLPPVDGAIPPADAPVKPKKAGSKILMTILGIFALLGVLGGGGYYAYQQLVPQAQVALVSEADCGKKCISDHTTVWNANKGKCEETHTACGSNGQPNPSPIDSSLNTKAKCEANSGNGTDPNGPKKGAWCAGCGGFCNTSNNTTCDQLQQTKCGDPVTRGASCSLASKTGFTAQNCNCDGTTVYFSATGKCEDVTNGVHDGLCDVYRHDNSCGGNGTTTTGGDTSLYTCNNNGCSLTAAGITANYYVIKYHCDTLVGANDNIGCTSNPSGHTHSQTFSATCGTEQIDVMQSTGNTPAAFKSRTNASACGTKASAPPSGPTLACKSITKNVADASIAVGSAITLTCAGSIAPTAAGTLSYDFRYSVGTGAWVTLANATATTATLTPNQCGVEYTAECRACATIAGVKQCDPVWTGASTQ